MNVPVSDFTPELADVGSRVRARTRTGAGVEAGTFTPDTRPTADQATNLIGQAVDDLSMLTGADLPESTWAQAKSVAAIGAAMAIELSYFPEQINSGASPYNQLKDLYDEMLAALLKSIQANGGETVGPEPGVPMEPVAYFPPIVTDPFFTSGRPW